MQGLSEQLSKQRSMTWPSMGLRKSFGLSRRESELDRSEFADRSEFDRSSREASSREATSSREDTPRTQRQILEEQSPEASHRRTVHTTTEVSDVQGPAPSETSKEVTLKFAGARKASCNNLDPDLTRQLPALAETPRVNRGSEASDPELAPPAEPSRMLLLLDRHTFVGDEGEALANHVRAAMGRGLPIVTVHTPELPELPNGCRFERLFSTTPPDLVAAGLYKAIAIPWFGGPHQLTSSALVLQALGAEHVHGKHRVVSLDDGAQGRSRRAESRDVDRHEWPGRRRSVLSLGGAARRLRQLQGCTASPSKVFDPARSEEGSIKEEATEPAATPRDCGRGTLPVGAPAPASAPGLASAGGLRGIVHDLI